MDPLGSAVQPQGNVLVFALALEIWPLWALLAQAVVIVLHGNSKFWAGRGRFKVGGTRKNVLGTLTLAGASKNHRDKILQGRGGGGPGQDSA